MHKTITPLLLAAALLLPGARALEFSVPHSFAAGTPIRAAEMNANFQALQTELRRLGLVSGFGSSLSGSAPQGWSLTNTSSDLVVQGIQGKITQAGKYSAGLRGEDATPGILSYGVEGVSASGTGVSGYSESGTGVRASSNTGAALEIDGAIRVGGSKPPAFVHVAAGGSYISCIDNPLTNNDPSAIVLFVHHWTSTYYTKPFGIYYASPNWCIFSEDSSQTIAAGTRFNVLVLKPAL